jgi:hypothetical protein
MKPHLVVHRHQSDRLYDPEVFNRAVAPFSDAEDTVRLLAREVSVHADGITYRPSTKKGFRRVVTIDGRRLVNTFRPSTIVPLPGDHALFLDFMEYLFPEDEDRAHVMRWCATLIARPEVRMRYGLLLISERQGVGKTTLVDAVLAPLVGRWNVSSPNEHQVTESGFNGWAAQKRLASINEIYSGHSRKTYDRLKQVISDDIIDVNQKFMEPFSIENWLHVAACSNSIRALHIDDGDRRWLVPRVTEKLQGDKSWWVKFHTWLKGGGLPHIAAWAEAYVRDGTVATGDRAPDTSAKKEVVNASRSEGARIAFDLAVDCVAQKREVVFLVDEVRQFVAGKRKLDIHDKRLETALTLRKALVEGGMKEPDHKPGTEKRVRTDDGLHYVVATFDIPDGTKWESLSAKKEVPM